MAVGGFWPLRLLMAFPAFSRHRGCGRIGQTPYTSSTYQLVCGISKKALAMALTSGVFWGILQVFFPCPLKKCRCAANFNAHSFMFFSAFLMFGNIWSFMGFYGLFLPHINEWYQYHRHSSMFPILFLIYYPISRLRTYEKLCFSTNSLRPLENSDHSYPSL